MNERIKAIEVLREARRILGERLTEKVNEQAEEILADARGDSYMNEIDTVYEVVGLKLAHVSQMLSNLPQPEAPPHSATAAAQHSPDDMFTVDAQAPRDSESVVEYTIPALLGPRNVVTPALPAPKTTESTKDRAATSALQAFAAQIQAGDLLAAGRTLAALFEIEETRAVACAASCTARIRSGR